MKLGILGYGNVGSSFCEGVIKAGFVLKDDIYVYNRGEARRAHAQEFGLNICENPIELFENADIIFIALKGYAFEEICENWDTSYLKGKCVVSFMAGMTIEETLEKLGVDCEVIRAMPTLAMVDCIGITGTVKNQNDYIKKLFSAIGFYFEVKECDIEKVTAYSGCGLGFAAYILNSYVKTGLALGFDSKTCEEITKLTFTGALKAGNYETTVKRVATKGGATEQGIEFMNQNKLDKLIENAVGSAFERYGK